jgi:release factor glutamine methyltransferase
MIVANFIKETTDKLKQAGSTSARLDTLVLLCDAWGKDKAWLLARPDQEVPANILANLRPKVAARAKRKPMAYIRGRQEFYGRDFVVNKHVLIPRPDSEALIDLLKSFVTKKPGFLIDIGTGSGALGVTAALECPNLQICLNEIDPHALAVASKNARRFKLSPQLWQGDLLEGHIGKTIKPFADYILANLPYVDRIWERSMETDYEPHVALFADDGGLQLIKRLLKQIPLALKPGGYLLMEADPRQHDSIISLAKDEGLEFVDQKDFTIVFKQSA